MRILTKTTLVAAVTVAAFASTAAAAQSRPPLIPNPADIVTVGAGSVTTGSPPDGQTIVGVNVGDTQVREGTTATVNILSKSPTKGDVAIGLLSGKNIAEARLGGLNLALPASLQIPGLSKLPLKLPKLGW